MTQPLSITHPDIAAQWHPDNDRAPDTVTAGAGYVAKWRCGEPLHVWSAPVFRRTGARGGCPVCANKLIVTGVNDLATLRPDIAAQWHPDNDKRADEVAVGAGYKALWRCGEPGHEWRTAVCNRTTESVSSGCPVCSNKLIIEGVNDLATTHPSIAAMWGEGNKKTPQQVSYGYSGKINWQCPSKHTWTTTVGSLTVQGTGCPVCSGRRAAAGVNDLAFTNPHIAAQWGPSNERGPETYRPGSSEVVEWVCDKGHTWHASVVARTKDKGATGCPVCSNYKMVTGINDLATTHPDIAAQWSGRNTLLASEVVAGSFKVVWWECADGHEWETTPASRRAGTGCPYCTGRFAVTGVTDIATTHPHLVSEWDSSNDKLPSEISAGSDYRAVWKCAKGHTWETQVKHRALRGQGCPTCVFRTYSSKGEKELQKFVADILPGVPMDFNSRQIKGVHEVDVLIPSLGIAIEYDGLYWHSEAAGRDKDYHRDKQLACKREGVRLYGVWEDDWRDRRTVVESMLRAKLGVSNLPKMNARELVIDTAVQRAESDLFLSKNHIQGPSLYSVALGLRDLNGNLVSLVLGTVRKGNMELTRYATSASVRGGFSRLLRVLDRESAARGCAAITTYSDNALSDGDLYRDNGFVHAGHVPPKYSLLRRGNRVHSASLKRDRIRNDPSLSYDPNKSLVELYADNNLHRIWDYGKVRWERKLSVV